MIEQLLLAAARSAEAFADRHDVELFPEEQAAVARSVEKRRREFVTVRGCARDALAQLGLAAVPLVPGERGAPGWPAGVVGSMTHCDGYRAAVAAKSAALASIGVDAEPDAPLPDGVLDTISLPRERAELRTLPTASGVAWDRLLFSAKESVYKTWFPLTRRWLDFEEAVVTIDPTGTFEARLLVTGPVVGGREISVFRGRWLAERGLIVTAIALPA